MYGVVQEILHTEPAAEIPPVKAQDVVQQQWAQSVELLAHGKVMTASVSISTAIPGDGTSSNDNATWSHTLVYIFHIFSTRETC